MARLAALLVAIALAPACVDPEPSTAKPGELSLLELQQVQAVWDMDVAKQPPRGPCPVGGTGLDWSHLMEERGSFEGYRQLVSSNSPERIATLTTGLGQRRQIFVLTALLDHPELSVRRAALASLRGRKDKRAVPGLVAAARHNNFELPDDAHREVRDSYRRELASALQSLTKVKPYQGPAPFKGGPKKIFSFDFARLDRWLERYIIEPRTWPK